MVDEHLEMSISVNFNRKCIQIDKKIWLDSFDTFTHSVAEELKKRIDQNQDQQEDIQQHQDAFEQYQPEEIKVIIELSFYYEFIG